MRLLKPMRIVEVTLAPFSREGKDVEYAVIGDNLMVECASGL